MATKVKLRTKPMTGSRLNLYLDFYPPIEDFQTGKFTRREFLARYLFNEIETVEEKYLDANGKEQKKIVVAVDAKGNPKKAKLTSVERQHNKETLYWAEQIRQKKDTYINKSEIYSGYEKGQLKLLEQDKQNFLDYFKKLADKRNGSNIHNWSSAYNYLKAFTGGSVKFSDLNMEFCDEFREYLLATPSIKSKKSTLSINSAKSYFDKFKASLREAYKNDYLRTDLNAKISSIKEEESQREFLDEKELNSLAKTSCQIPVLKQASIFSALTGLRFSDVEKLLWNEVIHIAGQGYYLKFKQAKTKGAEMTPISDETHKYLGDRKEPGNKVFEGLTYYDCSQNPVFSNWLKAAGITKHFTFHCFRHTFAVTQLINGTDLYTLSKMLGHRNIQTTQVYAHIVSEMTRGASEKIKLKN